MKQEVATWDFIASVTTDYDVCRYDKCSGHGQCKQIPFTKTHQCICEKNYEGESCEKRVDFDDSIEKLLSDLRRTFRVINGVPTTVDVYFSVRSLSKNLDIVMKEIQDSKGYTNKIVQHSQVIYDIEDIVDLYAKLQNNIVTFDQFGQDVDKYLQTVTTAFKLRNRLKKMILGRGLLDSPGSDIYNSYKRDYFSEKGGGCSAKYNEEVKSFRDKLAYLDQAFGEALLLHKKWLLETRGKTEFLRAKYKREAKYIRDTFKGRQQVYSQYWKSYSCGDLRINGTNIACKDELTFEGMTLTVSCDKQRQPSAGKVTCKRDEVVLKWDSQPKCKFIWSDWGNWGACSRTCGGGIQSRYRYCKGTNNVNDCIKDQGGVKYDTKSGCNPTDCCIAEGRYKCPSGKCINRNWLCDGDDDCGDRDDEDSKHCPTYIRSGDNVALKDYSRDQWLNCGGGGCTVGTCSGTGHSICGSEFFTLYVIENGKRGKPVRSGDRIALKYEGNEWLSCWVSGNRCKKRTCPGYVWNSGDSHCLGEMFYIYSPERSCTDTSISVGCKGDIIRKGDNVFIKYSEKNGHYYWVSHYGSDISTKPCPGRYIEDSDRTSCDSESWKIYVV